MIIYLSQGTQTTQNTQMNADLYFFSVQIGEALYFLRASAPVSVVCVLLMQSLNSHFTVSPLLSPCLVA